MNIEKILDNVSVFFQKAKTVLEKNFWPTFEVKNLPEYIQEEVYNLPPVAQQEFNLEFKKLTHKAKNSRNGILIFSIFALINGWFGVLIGVGFYFWHTKNKKLPKIADKAYQRVVSRYKLGTNKKSFFNNFTATESQYKAPPRGNSFTSSFVADKPRRIKNNYDPSHLTLENLKTGFMVDYETKTWQVSGSFQYDWDSHSSQHFALTSNIKTKHLFVHQLQNFAIYAIADPINIFSINESIEEEIMQTQKPPNVLHVKGEAFYREQHQKGTWFNLDIERSGQKIERWEYLSSDRTRFLSIEQKSNGNFQTFQGSLIQGFEFSDILPTKN